MAQGQESESRSGAGGVSGAHVHIGMLDGWRAVSILAVLAGHWLPLGPGRWGLNGVSAASGMALFFSLSGFLICRLMLADPRPGPFLVRRLARIVPLAWLAMLILAVATRADGPTLAANLLFTANLPPAHLMTGGEHLWSLCVEMQFYLAVAAIVALAGRRGLLLLPVLAIAVTVARVVADQPISIITWHRVDEILAGCIAALIVQRIAPGAAGAPRGRTWAALPVVLLLALLASAHPATGALQYLRPYFAAGTVLSSLYAAPALMRRVWLSAPARYIAGVSYAVYVFHGMLVHSWLGGIDATRLERLLRRPLLIAATFLAAHLSTRYYERFWIERGKRLIARRYPRPDGARTMTAGSPS